MEMQCKKKRIACLAALPLLWAATSLRADCPMLEGDVKEGGIAWARVAPGTEVRLDGEALDVLDDGWFMLGFHRDAPRTQVLEAGEDCRVTLNISARDYRIQRVEGVPQRTVTPPPEQLERIRRERALVQAAKAQRIERDDWLSQVAGGFRWPLTGPISVIYGSQRFYNGKAGTPHYGVDIARPTGTVVHAPAAGRVTLAEGDLFYSGGTVILDHGYGLSSSFLHMSEVTVEVGDELEAGDPLGAVGSTGRATGPHLDWRMSWRDRRIDPQLLVPPMSDGAP